MYWMRSTGGFSFVNPKNAASGYLNVIDQLYDHENPDNWRLPKDCSGVPDIL